LFFFFFIRPSFKSDLLTPSNLPPSRSAAVRPVRPSAGRRRRRRPAMLRAGELLSRSHTPAPAIFSFFWVLHIFFPDACRGAAEYNNHQRVCYLHGQAPPPTQKSPVIRILCHLPMPFGRRHNILPRMPSVLHRNGAPHTGLPRYGSPHSGPWSHLSTAKKCEPQIPPKTIQTCDLFFLRFFSRSRGHWPPSRFLGPKHAILASCEICP